MKRRAFILGGASLMALSLTGKTASAMDIFSRKPKAGTTHTMKDTSNFPFQLTDEEWRKRLTPEQYKILREEGTEKSCSSPLNGVEGQGKFYCAGCGHLLFSTDTKFDSKSGWPSFYQPIDEHAVGTSTDYKLLYPRTEVHCSNCGSHLGHVFEDGPKPTGLRYCINGLALDYTQESASE